MTAVSLGMSMRDAVSAKPLFRRAYIYARAIGEGASVDWVSGKISRKTRNVADDHP